MDKQLYINTRRQYVELASEIVRSDKNFKKNMIKAASKFGFWINERLTLEDEEQISILMDYRLFELNGNDSSLIQSYKENSKSLDEPTKSLLNAMILNYDSLFEITYTDSANCTVQLLDLVSKKEFRLIDIALSHTAEKGMLLYTRLIPFNQSYMTSGLLFSYYSQFKLRLLEYVSKHLNTTRSSTTLLEHMFEALNKYGKQIETI